MSFQLIKWPLCKKGKPNCVWEISSWPTWALSRICCDLTSRWIVLGVSSLSENKRSISFLLGKLFVTMCLSVERKSSSLPWPPKRTQVLSTKWKLLQRRSQDSVWSCGQKTSSWILGFSRRVSVFTILTLSSLVVTRLGEAHKTPIENFLATWLSREEEMAPTSRQKAFVPCKFANWNFFSTDERKTVPQKTRALISAEAARPSMLELGGWGEVRLLRWQQRRQWLRPAPLSASRPKISNQAKRKSRPYGHEMAEIRTLITHQAKHFWSLLLVSSFQKLCTKYGPISQESKAWRV